MSSRKHRLAVPLIATLGSLAAAVAPAPASAGWAGTEQISQSAVNGNGAVNASFEGASDDGRRAFFETAEQLAATDTDFQLDVYMREGATTTHVSRGQIGGNGEFNAFFGGTSSDGGRVFFSTDERLAPSDVDTAGDVYMREGGATTFITGGLADLVAIFIRSSNDGGRVIFGTSESLVAADNDSAFDAYMSEGGVITVLSDGPGVFFTPAFVSGASADGRRVFFETGEPLVAATDTDTQQDVYMSESGALTQVSRGQIGGNDSTFGASFRGASDDGTRVFFTTREQLAASDTDSQDDIYMREGATTTHISQGQIGGNGAAGALFGGASTDGGRVFFRTSEQLTPSDTDVNTDLYMREGATTTHLSQGQSNGGGASVVLFEGASSDGGRVFLRTDEQLAASDTDARFDIYMREGSTTTHISQGQINGNGNDSADTGFAGASSDGARVFFHTLEPLVPSDTDGLLDAYVREGGVTTLVSQGPTGGAGTSAAVVGFTGDGSRAFLITDDRLTASDLDNALDVYAATIDSAAPETTIDSGPPSKTTATEASLSYSSSESGSSFECRIDAAAFASCPVAGTSFTGLAPGSHTFSVRATDVATNTDPTPAERTWTIEPASCRGRRATIVGTEGADRLKGTKGRDVIAALGGKDKVKAGKGNDVVCGGSGNDRLSGDGGNDKLFGEQGKDRLLGDTGRDLTNGGPGTDACNGGRSRDRGRGCERGPES